LPTKLPQADARAPLTLCARSGRRRWPPELVRHSREYSTASKAVASNYGLSRIGPPSADSGHIEGIVRLWRALVFNVFSPDFIRHIAATRYPVSSCLQVLAPVPLP